MLRTTSCFVECPVFYSSCGDFIVAKNRMNSCFQFAPHTHVINDPKESNWISFSGSFGVSFWYAIGYNQVGEQVTMSIYSIPHKKLVDVTRIFNPYSSSSFHKTGIRFGRRCNEFLVSTKLEKKYLISSVSFSVSQEDIDWCENADEDTCLFTIPQHRKEDPRFQVFF